MDRTPDYFTLAGAWLTAAIHLVSVTLPDPENAYRKVADSMMKSARDPRTFGVDKELNGLKALLQRLAKDVQAGMIMNIEARISGETFDDLLDHAEAYLREKRHEPAGVLGGVVFEDAVRRLSAKHGIDPAGKELDSLLNALKSQGVLTKLEAKEGVVAAEVRAKATHTEWTAFNAEQADATIKFARRLIRDKLMA